MATKKLFTAKNSLSLDQLHKRQNTVLELAEKSGLAFFGYANNKRTRMTIGLADKQDNLVVGWVADVEEGTMKSIIPSSEGISIPSNFDKIADALTAIKKLS